MKRCVQLGFAGPRILDDFASILDGLVVPLLRGRPEPIGGKDCEQDKALLSPDSAATGSGKPSNAQGLKFGGAQPQSAASSSSSIADDESVCF